jgi:sugar lactone lactonase YvrE
MLLGMVILCALAVAATSTSASVAAKLLPFALKPIGGPNAVSIDQVTGNVYVTDHVTATVKIFGGEGGSPTGVLASSGEPAEVTGVETPSGAFNFLGPSEPVGVAVDGSGDLYVADVGNKVVDKFELEGGKYKYVCQFTGFGNTGNGCLPNLVKTETEPTEPFTGPGGIAIDRHGNVYISNFGGAVYEFNSAGEDVRQAAIPTGEPSGVAVDSNGVVYVQDYQGPVYRLTVNAMDEFEATILDSEKAYAVAVDPTTNNVYVDHLGYIAVRGAAEGRASGDIIGEVHPKFFESEGVAIGAGGQNLYAPNSLTRSVEVFHLVRIPDVKISAATEVGVDSAKLSGEMDIEETSGAGYHFEYGPDKEFNLTTIDESFTPVDSNEFEPVTPIEVADLQPNTEYNYRLVAANSALIPVKSEEGTFTTSRAKAEISPLEATEVTTSSVIFGAKVNPENTPPAAYRFEYREAGGELHRLPEFAIGASDEQVPISEFLPTGLKPNTTYGYLLVVTNSAGETTSPEQSFTTPPAPNLATTPPRVNTGSAVSISQGGATLTGVVIPEELPTLYAFEVGTTHDYGTVIFGGGVEAHNEHEGVPVEQTVGDLQPGVTYHYRLVAFNAAGVKIGLDGTFTTAASPFSIAQPIALPILATPVFPEVKYPEEKEKKKKHITRKKKHSKSKHHAKGKVKKPKRK